MAVIEYDSHGNPHNESGKRIAQTMSVPQLYRMFPDDAACRKWIEKVRWDGKPTCPRCGTLDAKDVRKAPPSKPEGNYWCKPCRRFFTVTVGTCLHATKADLQHWVYAIHSVLTARKGVSALQFSKELGVQYRTAWHMLHRIREACGKGQFKLANVVEVDETHIGGLEKNKHESKKLHAGRGAVGKEAVAGIRERGGKVKAQPVARTDAPTLRGFVEETAETGTTVHTDDAAAYGALPSIINQYVHDTVAHGKGEYVRGDVHTNGIESVWAVLERSIHGTWHHVSPKHLGRYVDEASFRLNEGNCEVDTMDRMESLVRQMDGARLSYADLVADNGESNRPVAV